MADVEEVEMLHAIADAKNTAAQAMDLVQKCVTTMEQVEKRMSSFENRAVFTEQLFTQSNETVKELQKSVTGIQLSTALNSQEVKNMSTTVTDLKSTMTGFVTTVTTKLDLLTTDLGGKIVDMKSGLASAKSRHDGSLKTWIFLAGIFLAIMQIIGPAIAAHYIH
jgi:uncharacterized coiled-coil protein SlyX